MTPRLSLFSRRKKSLQIKLEINALFFMQFYVASLDKWPLSSVMIRCLINILYLLCWTSAFNSNYNYSKCVVIAKHQILMWQSIVKQIICSPVRMPCITFYWHRMYVFPINSNLNFNCQFDKFLTHWVSFWVENESFMNM